MCFKKWFKRSYYIKLLVRKTSLNTDWMCHNVTERILIFFKLTFFLQFFAWADSHHILSLNLITLIELKRSLCSRFQLSVRYIHSEWDEVKLQSYNSTSEWYWHVRFKLHSDFNARVFKVASLRLQSSLQTPHQSPAELYAQTPDAAPEVKPTVYFHWTGSN